VQLMMALGWVAAFAISGIVLLWALFWPRR
jgi:hypothetical protein